MIFFCRTTCTIDYKANHFFDHTNLYKIRCHRKEETCADEDKDDEITP